MLFGGGYDSSFTVFTWHQHSVDFEYFKHGQKIEDRIESFVFNTVKPQKWRIFSPAKTPPFAKTTIFEAIVFHQFFAFLKV